MFKSAAICVGTAMLLAGCASTPNVPEEVVSSPPVMADETSSLNWSDTNVVQPFPTPHLFRPVTPATRPRLSVGFRR